MGWPEPAQVRNEGQKGAILCRFAHKRRPIPSTLSIMNKAKSPKTAKPNVPSAVADEQDDALVRKLLRLALDLRDLDDYSTLSDELKKKKSELRKLVRKCLQQNKDAVLEEALERTEEEDGGAYGVLKANVEELSEVIVFRRDSGPDIEVNAFVIPLFVRSTGGLRAEQCFADEQAFDALRDSLQEAGLESRRAGVVLVAHAYHRDEIARIGYSRLNAMVHEAHDALTRKKLAAADAIAASMSGWPESGFAADDPAVELRFLLGFALKALDDPFYAIPEREAEAERYFDARAKRFRKWAEDASALVKRCLVTDGREIEVDFLYQDLFYGGTATGMAEYDMLQLLTELQQGLQAQNVAPDDCLAVAGPGEEDMLRVNLYTRADHRLIASADRPGLVHDLQAEAEELYEALQALGLRELALTREFDGEGQPLAARAWKPR